MRQTVVGLGLAAALLAAWLTLHVYGVFLFPLSLETAWAAPVMIAVQTWLGAGLFIVAHDCMHGSLAPGRPLLNAVVGRLMLTIYAGFDFRKLIVKHHAHHRLSGHDGDPDFHAGAPRRFWPWYVKFFREYYGWTQQAAIAGVLLVYVLVFRASPVNALLFWGLPAILSSFQLFAFGTWLPHRHEDAPFDDHHNARTRDFGWLLSLVTCFHFGYHLEHHRSPRTPWWALPSVRRASVGAGADRTVFIHR
jgi:beta-carotene ketolase (CrtW type)